MAKFVFKMQNILAVKEKLESQAKAEYGLEISKLREEEQKKILLEQKKLYYEQQLTECLHDTLDMPRIKQYEQAVEDMKICIREQQHIIKQQEEKEQETPPQQQTSTPTGQEQPPQQKRKDHRMS